MQSSSFLIQNASLLLTWRTASAARAAARQISQNQSKSVEVQWKSVEIQWKINIRQSKDWLKISQNSVEHQSKTDRTILEGHKTEAARAAKSTFSIQNPSFSIQNSSISNQKSNILSTISKHFDQKSNISIQNRHVYRVGSSRSMITRASVSKPNDAKIRPRVWSSVPQARPPIKSLQPLGASPLPPLPLLPYLQAERDLSIADMYIQSRQHLHCLYVRGEAAAAAEGLLLLPVALVAGRWDGPASTRI